MSINYNVDDYWKDSYKAVISKDHFAKFLKGYPFQVFELNMNKFDDFFELTSIQKRMNIDGNIMYCFTIKQYTYIPFQGCYVWDDTKVHFIRDIADILNLFKDSVCMDYEYYKKHNLGIPKMLVHSVHHLHSGQLNNDTDYLFLCDLYEYEPSTEYTIVGLNKIYRKQEVKGAFSNYYFLSGSTYNLYLNTTYRRAVGNTIQLMPLVTKAYILNKHRIYLKELWEEYLKENKSFTDDLTNRSIEWS